MAKSVNKPFAMRLPDDVRAKLQSLAAEKGTTESDLGRMLIIEKLAEHEGKRDELRVLAALIIAALSESIDIDQAHQLIAEHLTLKPEGTT